MPKKKEAKPKVTKKEEGAFNLEIEIGDETLKANNDDLITAFESLKPLPVIQNTVLVRVEYEGRKHEEALNVARARRAFGGNMTALLFFNNMKLMVGAKK